MRPILRAVAGALLAAAVVAAPAAADTVVADDQIVQGSNCVGPDCVNNESFGFDTVLLKGPALRLGFLDTSSASGFPSNDWELTANDADGAGTGEYFAFTDVTAGHSPLRVLAGAPTDTLQAGADGAVRLANGPLLQRVDGTSTENAVAADPAALRTALAALPVSRFEFAADPANTLHLGPTAADFNTAFGVGSGSTYLSPADMAGVALAVARELTIKVDDLTGPQGPQGATGPVGAKGDTGPRGDTGAKGDTGAAGADAYAPAGVDAVAARLTKLEGDERALRATNLKLRAKVRILERRIRRLTAAGR